MNITILRRTNKGLRNINLSGAHLSFFFLFSLLVIPVGGGWLGYKWALEATSDYDQVKLAALNWESKYQAKVEEFERYQRQSENHLNGLAARLGSLQAQVNRINAVGQRILELNGLDSGEFDFELEPSLGGPYIDVLDTQSTVENRDFDQGFEKISGINTQLQSHLEQFLLIENLLLNQEIGVEKYISGRPIKRGWLSSNFGKRIDPFKGKPAWHEGVDFAGKEGADVVATASGVVTYAGERYGYGSLVEINHGDGMTTRYAHNKKIHVKKGQLVAKGQVIAAMGSSGRSTGPHVHYEVLNKGRPVNPLKYVYRKPKKSLSKVAELNAKDLATK